MKRWVKIGSISIVLTLSVGYVYFNTLTYKNVRVLKGDVIFSGKEKDNRDERTSNLVKNEAKVYEINDIKIYINNKEIKLKTPIYEQNQRYYLNLEDFLTKLNIDFEKDKNIYKFNQCKLDLKDRTFTLDSKSFELRGELLKDKKNYICLNDLEHMLNLRDRWNQEKREIYLFNEKKNIDPADDKTKVSGKAAMMRVEDFAPGGEYLKSDIIEKYKIIADYLYSKDFKFNIAWISRYKNPPMGIDNNLLEDRSMANVQYMNLMDHLIFRGGTVGLHGYTHQYGDEVSAIGSDLSSKANNTKEDTEVVIKSAIETAEALNVPIDFFESAHYHSTIKQQRIIEKYFDIVYEPFKFSLAQNPLKSPMDKSTLYLSTNLGYVKDERGEIVANRIRKNAKSSKISSFYFHPIKEFKFIKLGDMDEYGYADYSYDEDSIMHNISKALEDTEQVTISVKDLR